MKTSSIDRRKLWAKRHREMGLCISCSRKAVSGGRCKEHMLTNKNAAKAFRDRKKRELK